MALQQPYIGLAGVSKKEDVERLLRMQPPPGYKFGIGVLVSDQTLDGNINPHFPGRYPAVNTIGDLFLDHPFAFNVAHLWVSGRSSGVFMDYIYRIDALAGPNLHGIQLNNPLLPLATVRMIRDRWPKLKIILPLTGRVFREAANDCDLVDYVNRYCDVIDYVLYDASGGKKLPLDTPIALRHLELLSKTFTRGIGWGVAGGLGPFTMERVNGLFSRISSLSCDAEGELCPNDEGFEVVLGEEYLIEATKKIIHVQNSRHWA
jgi:hypothetical protein